MKRLIVSAGEYATARAPVVLETFLGSCVGVALYDWESRIGGLLHVILPEGTAKKEAKNPAAYAKTGIPHLLAAMEEEGAARGQVQAVIAGGAHIKVGDGLPNLKIGLRNIQAVREVLGSQAIPVLQEDVGGTHGRRLLLFLEDGRVEVRSSRPRARERSSDPALPIAPLLEARELEAAIEELRPVSDVALKALEMARDPGSGFQRLERLILQDQVLTANILRLVNSAYYGLRVRIATISQAVAFLGLKAFRKLVLQSFVYHLVARRLDAYSLEDGALFRHSVACARFAEALAHNSLAVNPDEAYVAGLLHDLGKVVLARCAGPHFSRVMDRVIFQNRPFFAAEHEVLGVDHARAGRLVAGMWRLPEELTEAVALHHRPLAAHLAPDLVGLVHIADMLCNAVGIGMAADAMANHWEPRVLEELRMDEQAIESLLASVPLIVGSHGEL